MQRSTRRVRRDGRLPRSYGNISRDHREGIAVSLLAAAGV
jgi:hypothetical protein